MRSADSVEEPVLPHRYIFYAMNKKDRDSLRKTLPRVRQRAHVAAILPSAQLGDLTGLLTHTFPLSEWQDAFATIADQGRTGAIKVAIDPQR